MSLVNNKAIAIFGCLPPTNSAIGKYTLASFGSWKTPLHFFSNFETAQEWEMGKGLVKAFNSHHELFHPDIFSECFSKYKYEHAIFIFGNSYHHTESIWALVKYSKLHEFKKHIYLHEAQITHLIIKLFADNEHLLLPNYRLFYPEKASLLTDYGSIFENKVLGLRLIQGFAAPDSFISNSVFCTKLVKDEVGTLAKKDLNFANVFLPNIIKEAPEVNSVKSPLKLGSFGIPHKVKHIDTIIGACDILAAQKVDLEFILAGYGTSHFVNQNNLNRPYLKIYDAPNDNQMLELMKSVHIGLQLRWPSHGESSASISELLGLGKLVIATDVGSFSDLNKFAILTPVDVSSENLAKCILETQKREFDYDSFSKEYSVANFQKLFLEKICYSNN